MIAYETGSITAFNNVARTITEAVKGPKTQKFEFIHKTSIQSKTRTIKLKSFDGPYKIMSDIPTR